MQAASRRMVHPSIEETLRDGLPWRQKPLGTVKDLIRTVVKSNQYHFIEDFAFDLEVARGLGFEAVRLATGRNLYSQSKLSRRARAKLDTILVPDTKMSMVGSNIGFCTSQLVVLGAVAAGTLALCHATLRR